MGFFRGALLVLSCIALVVFLMGMGTFGVLSKSLQYEVVKPEAKVVIKNLIYEKADLSIIDDNMVLLEKYCVNESEFVYSEPGTGFMFVIPCDTLIQGTDPVIDYGADYLVDQMYYQDYNCDFWNCFESEGTPFFLFSEKSQQHWNSKFKFFLLISILLLIPMFFLIEKKTTLPILIGIILALCAFPIAWLDSIGTMISNLLISPLNGVTELISQETISSVIQLFFTKANYVFLRMFIIALISILVGIILKLIFVGFKINKLFSKKDKKDSSPKKKEDSSTKKE